MVNEYLFSTSRSSQRAIHSLKNKRYLTKPVEELSREDVIKIVERLKGDKLKPSTIIFSLNAIKRLTNNHDVKSLTPKSLGLFVTKERDDERVSSIVKNMDGVIKKAFHLIKSYEGANTLSLKPHTAAAIGIVICFLTNTRSNEITRLTINDLLLMDKKNQVTLSLSTKYGAHRVMVYILNDELWELIKVGLFTAICAVNHNYRTTLKSHNELLIKARKFSVNYNLWVTQGKDIDKFPIEITYEKAIPVTSTELNRQVKLWYIYITGEKPSISLGLKRVRDFTSTKLQEKGFLEIASCFSRHKSTNSTIQYDKTDTASIAKQLNELEPEDGFIPSLSNNSYF